jgi:hypothetical protein
VVEEGSDDDRHYHGLRHCRESRHSSFNTALLRAAAAAAPAGCTVDIDVPEAMARLRRTNFRIRPEVLNAVLARDAER